jgi:hypothetical protein
MPRAFCAVAFIALIVLLPRAALVGLAGCYVDPVSRITAQDEALYAHSAIDMALHGDWATPHFMGRLALYKPPLLYWLSALSAKLLGISRLALRLPIALIAALSAGLIFLWAAEVDTWQAGVAAAALLLSNHLWTVLGALCMTDALLVAFSIAAFYALFSDPWLESQAALLTFAGAVAAAILTKGMAGILPLGVLGLYWLAAPRPYRPAFLRLCLAGLLALLFASPWFIYQALVHPRWFWMEHIGIEILGYGSGAPPQTSREPQALFYMARLAATDPILVALAAGALPQFWSSLRRRSFPAVLLACWLAVAAAGVLVWQYRNASYLLPLVPALAILAAAYSPFLQRRYAVWTLAAIGAVFVVKCALPEMSWGLAFDEPSVQPLAAALASYCDQRRGNPLIIVDVADDLFASALPLERLRYAVVGPGLSAGPRYGMPFEQMGIAVTVPQFNDLPALEPQFRKRLRAWGIDSPAPIATLILARDPDELAALSMAHGDADFLVPTRYRSAVALAPHAVSPAGFDYFFLISRRRQERAAPPAWTCHM